MSDYRIKKLLWRFLITKGKRIESESHYGDIVDVTCYDIDIDKHFKKVSWKTTREPQTDTESVFNGTFCDPSDITVYGGTLHLQNGKKELWKFEVDEDIGYSDLIRMVLECEE